MFGLAFALEGFAFFLEAIFIAIYVYGWDRLSPRVHFLCGLPIVATGFLGAAMVIAVNGWMNHPGGFRLAADGDVTDVHPWSALFGNSFFWHELVHMYFAAYIVVGFLLAGVYAYGKLRHGRWGRYERTALAIPLTIAALAAPAQLLVGDWAAREVATSSRSSWPRSRGCRTRRRARASTCSAGTRGTPATSRAGSRSPTCCRCSPTTTRTRPSEGSPRCRPTTAPARST